MTCKEFREEIELYVGQDTLTEELESHLAVCESCRRVADEFRAFSSAISPDDTFYPNDIESTRMLWQINERIDKKSQRVRPAWYRYAAAAAVVLIIGGTAAVITKYGPFGDGDRPGIIMDSATDTLAWVDRDTLLSSELEPEEVQLLIQDYSANEPYTAGEDLAGELTDEELKYLEEHFDVGDLL